MAQKKTSSKKTSAKKAKRPSVLRKLATPFTALVRYVLASWNEIRQVRWPDRKSSWSLTAAVLIFTAFFVGLIVLLDYVFRFLFKEILL